MSTKRARNAGNEPLKVTWPPGAVYPEYEEVVEAGHWLSDDAPAKLRDALLKRDDFTEVNQSETPKASKAPTQPEDGPGPLEETK